MSPKQLQLCQTRPDETVPSFESLNKQYKTPADKKGFLTSARCIITSKTTRIKSPHDEIQVVHDIWKYANSFSTPTQPFRSLSGLGLLVLSAQSVLSGRSSIQTLTEKEKSFIEDVILTTNAQHSGKLLLSSVQKTVHKTRKQSKRLNDIGLRVLT